MGDFGSACFARGVGIRVGDGTLHYMSPEMHRQMLGETIEVDYYKSDIYSLGVTILHLAKLTMPSSISLAWKDTLELKQAVEIETIGLNYSKEFINLIRQMLESNPEQRPSTEEMFMRTSLAQSEQEYNEAKSSRKDESFPDLESLVDAIGNTQLTNDHRDFDKLLLRYSPPNALRSEEQTFLPYYSIYALYVTAWKRICESKIIIEELLIYHDNILVSNEIRAMALMTLTLICCYTCQYTEAEIIQREALKLCPTGNFAGIIQCLVNCCTGMMHFIRGK